MEQYIPKSVVLAEIERLRGLLPDANDCDYLQLEFARGQQDAFTDFEEFIRTLEVKEVDLDKSARHYLLHEHISPLNEVLHQADLKVEMQYHKDIEDAYKAGFELGLKAKGGQGMNRHELIEHWKEIAMAVFVAESKIIDEWAPRLRNAKANGDESVADEYLEAIAKEIIGNSNVNEKEE